MAGMTLYEAVHEPGSPEWMAARRGGLGASEVGAVLGLDPYKTGLDIWLEKRGMAEPRQGDTMAQKVGRHAEAMIAGLYVAETGAELVQVPTKRHEALSVLFASADRMVVGPEQGWVKPVEIKNRGGIPKGWGDAGTDQVPEYIAVQVHVQMACYGLDRADVAALLGGNDFRVFTLHRDAGIEATLLGEVEGWWQRHMVEGVEPAITGPSAGDYLAKKFRQVTGDVVKADARANELLWDLSFHRGTKKQSEEAEERVKIELQQIIGTNKGIDGEAGRALWSPTKGRTTTDWKALAVELGATPEQIARFTTVGPETRTFRFTPTKEV